MNLQTFYEEYFYKVFKSSAYLVGVSDCFEFDVFEEKGLKEIVKQGNNLNIQSEFLSDLHKRNISSIKRDYLEFEIHKKNPILYLERIVFSLTFLSSSFLKTSGYIKDLQGYLEIAKENLSSSKKINSVYLDFSKSLLQKIVDNFTLSDNKEGLRIVKSFSYFLGSIVPSLKVNELYETSYLRNIFDCDLAIKNSFESILEFAYKKKREILNLDTDVSRENKTELPKDIINLYNRSKPEIISFLKEDNLIRSELLSNLKLSVREATDSESFFMPFAASRPPKIINTESNKSEVIVNLNGSNNKLHRDFKLIFAHEGIPGHYFQRVANSKLTPKDTLLITGIDWFTNKSQIRTNLFCEGWALYWEELLANSGYLGDGGKRTVLNFELWRINRLIYEIELFSHKIDFKKANLKWAKERRIDINSARKELIHYALKPSHPSSYILGKYQLMALKNKFDGNLNSFHQELLKVGPVPFNLISKYSLLK